MTDEGPTRNIALLIDADNASWHAIDPVLTVLAELGSVGVRRAYGNWSKSALQGWRNMTIKHGIEPQQQFDLTKGKNATDMKMTIDAMDLLFRGRVHGFGIMSSDSDFMPLATRIRQEGLPVYGFGRGSTPEGFRQACTRFIDVDALIADGETEMAVSDASAGETSAGVGVGVGEVSADVPIEDALPPAIATARARAAKGGKAPVDPDLLKLLIDAYDATKRDEKGFVSLSAMGQLAANRSSFDARNYGYKRLSDLIEAVPNFQTDRQAGGQILVRRVR